MPTRLHVLLIRHGRRTCTARDPALRGMPARGSARTGARCSAAVSEGTLRHGAEVALVGIAAVWGLTFVMVQDAIAELPTMAFLGYRFLPAALLMAAVFWSPAAPAAARGLAAGVLMGVFLTAGYVFQTLGLEQTTVSNAGFITGHVRGAHAGARRRGPARPDRAARLGGSRGLRHRPLPAVRSGRRLPSARRRPGAARAPCPSRRTSWPRPAPLAGTTWEASWWCSCSCAA